MGVVDKKDLGYLGENFQYKLIHTFMEEKEFFKDISGIVDQNMFTDPTLKVFVGVMKEYYEREEAVPSYTMMSIALNQKAHNEIEKETFQAVLQKIANTPSDGVSYIRELAEKFFKQQNIIKTANEILKIAGDGDTSKYEKCLELLNNALNQGTREEYGSSVFDDIGETLSDDYRTPIPTGIGKLDEALEGGLGKGELGVIIGPSSFGKVMPNDEIVMTPFGPKYNGDIKVGDYVLGKNGQPTKVIEVFPHENWDFYKVTFSDGVFCECGLEHLWNVNSLSQRCRKKYIGKNEFGKKIYKHLNDKSFHTLSLKEIVEKGLFKGKRHNFSIPMCDPVHFQEKEVRINPYLLGYMLGDGCFSRNSLTIGKCDISHARQHKLLQEYEYNEHIGHKDSTYIFQYKKSFHDALMYYYGSNLKSHEKYIPTDYLYNSLENRVLLLNGLMDTDGSVKKSGTCTYSTKSLELAKNVQFLVFSLGGYCQIKEKKCGYFNKVKNEYIDCGKYYFLSFSLINEKIPIFQLLRKQALVKYRKKYINNRFFHSVEYSRTCDGQCIKVDSDDELYLTKDFIVTHNTSLTTAMASHASTYKCESNNFKGFKVLQIVFEDRIKQIQRKHIGRITGIESKDLSKKECINDVLEQLSKYEDKEMMMSNLKILRLPSGEITPNKIERLIKKMINNGFKPDLCIIDYFECLSHIGDSHSNEYEKEGKTMRKLESMASYFDMAIWVPTQGVRDSVNLELVTMDKAGGSFKKIQIAHIVMSIARTMEDIERNKATIALLKNRAGKSGKVFNNVEFNNGTCRISTDGVDEFESMIEYNKNAQKDKEILVRNIYMQSQQKK